MVGQDDPGIYVERGSPAHLAHRVAQRADVGDEQLGPAVEQVHSEEIARSRDPITAIVRHRNSMPEIR